MQAIVIYESMYGNTHLIADAIADGLGSSGVDARAVPVGDATTDEVAAADLVVVGGPTHGHGMSRESTRDAAVHDAREPGSDLSLDPDAEGEGLREWFDALPAMGGAAAAFDTRFDMAPVLTGRASKGISKRLRRHGFHEVAEPRSFLVQKGNTLVEGQRDAAVEWGMDLATRVPVTPGS